MSDSVQRILHISGLERIPYDSAYERQQEMVERCLDSGGRDNFLMLVEHPPVITIGRSSEGDDVLVDSEQLRERDVDVVETNRGGKATFHGPGQLVVYPIIDLRGRGRDLHRYLRDLEGWLVSLLAGYDIEAEGKSSHTGVWIDGDKIASIGIAVRRWISYHGIALNVNNDMSFFELIIPCGLPDVRMISMKDVLDLELDMNAVAKKAARTFSNTFGFEDVVSDV
ncbi:MAG: lipoyl(octanoyl) transferase LipB [Planctomycetota bacterium]